MKLNYLLLYFITLLIFPLTPQAAETWDEFVTVSEFNIQPVCWYKGNTSVYERDYGEQRVYAFHIKSKYKLFHHYNDLALKDAYYDRYVSTPTEN